MKISAPALIQIICLDQFEAFEKKIILQSSSDTCGEWRSFRPEIQVLSSGYSNVYSNNLSASEPYNWYILIRSMYDVMHAALGPVMIHLTTGVITAVAADA